MSDENRPPEEQEGRLNSLKDQFQDQHKELELPSFVDKNKVENLRERKQRTTDEINRIMKGLPKGKAPSKKLIFVMPGDEKKIDRKIGDRWVDENGKEWEQKDGYVASIPKIDRSELEDVLMPLDCPKCGKKMKHWLDKKMWPIHRMCFDCVTEMETKLREEGKYKEYERQKIMANMRSFYHDVVNSMDDVVKSFHASYVNSFGDVEKWDGGLTDEQIRQALENDLKQFRESFQEQFGEPLVIGDNDEKINV